VTDHDHNETDIRKLANQVALVTGGGRGLGRVYAQALAIAGIIGLLFLFGCGDNTISTAPTPVGATSGLNTFIFFYTDT